LDEAGRESIGPIVGLGRRKDKHNYPRPQVEEEENANQGAHQRSAGYEETIGITHSCTDTKKGMTSSNGTSLRVGNIRHCIRETCR
jgi:hypothetical protein